MKRTIRYWTLAVVALGVATAVGCGEDGKAGASGSSCTVTDNGNGTHTLSCSDGTRVTIADGAEGQEGANGAQGEGCSVTGAAGNGTATVDCDDGTQATLASGADGEGCSVTDNGDGTATLSCEDGTNKTWAICLLGSFRCSDDGGGAGGAGGGSSELLELCDATEGWKTVETCGDGCQPDEGRCGPPDGTLRIDGGGDAGRLEVMHDGMWGTICDDVFDGNNNAANVACKALGYSSGVLLDNGSVADGNGPIWMDDLACDGTESSLLDCDGVWWGTANCDHTEDVGVTCTP